MTATPHRGLVLLTGASSGIGAAATRRFVAAGYRVAGIARDSARLDALCEQLGGSERFTPLTADVTDAAGMEAALQRVLAEIGLPDIVVANAGIGMDALFARTTDEAFQRVLDVNVLGVLRTLRPFVQPMAARGSGRIVIVSSIVGKRGIPFYTAYSASKFALHGMADALRAELYGTGVTLGLLCPSSTATEFSERRITEGPKQNRVRPRTHSADSVGQALVRMAQSRRREQILGIEAKLMHWVDCVAPGLIDRILAGMLRKREPES